MKMEYEKKTELISRFLLAVVSPMKEVWNLQV